MTAQHLTQTNTKYGETRHLDEIAGVVDRAARGLSGIPRVAAVAAEMHAHTAVTALLGAGARNDSMPPDQADHPGEADPRDDLALALRLIAALPARGDEHLPVIVAATSIRRAQRALAVHDAALALARRRDPRLMASGSRLR